MNSIEVLNTIDSSPFFHVFSSQSTNDNMNEWYTYEVRTCISYKNNVYYLLTVGAITDNKM